MSEMKSHNFIHYEISNFCKEGFYSKHNSSYWKGESYLGFGPSAHSYNGDSRQWNVSSNQAYISSIQKNILPFEKEILTQEQKFNEYIMTSLRTIWGIDFDFVKDHFPEDYIFRLQTEVDKYIAEKCLFREGEKVRLTDKGKLFADRIASDLFIIS